MARRKKTRRKSLPRRLPLPRWLWLVLLALLVLGRIVGLWPSGPPHFLEPGLYHVAEVIDGDTLRLTNGARIRLIGVDAPELRGPDGTPEPYAEAAAEFVRHLIAAAEWQVRLEFDAVLKDRYGRFLAYVYAGDVFVNEELLRQGLARSRLEFNFSGVMKKRFQRAEQTAQETSTGIWSISKGSHSFRIPFGAQAA